MNRDTIIRLAREAGWSGIYSQWVSPTEREHLTVPVTMEQIERFADLVAAHEREECAKVCDEYNDGRYANAADLCAAAIRSRT